MFKNLIYENRIMYYTEWLNWISKLFLLLLKIKNNKKKEFKWFQDI